MKKQIMRRINSAFITAATITAASVAVGAPKVATTASGATPTTTPAMTEMPQPSKELDAYMKPFEGTWTCDSKIPAGMFGPSEVAAKANVRFKKEANGLYWRGQYQIAKQKGVPMQFGAEFFVSYDPGSKQLIFNGIDTTGGSFFETGRIDGASASFTGDGYMKGNKVKLRETMWSKDKTAGHTAEVDMGKGQGFVSMAVDNCKR